LAKSLNIEYFHINFKKRISVVLKEAFYLYNQGKTIFLEVEVDKGLR